MKWCFDLSMCTLTPNQKQKTGVVSGSHIGVTSVRSSLDGFIGSRIGTCGLDISGTQNRYKRNRGTDYSWEGNLVNTEFTHIYFPYAFIPQKVGYTHTHTSKSGGGRRKTALP